jgi:hypothetical protein
MEEQVSELWPTTFIQRATLAVDHGSGVSPQHEKFLS